MWHHHVRRAGRHLWRLVLALLVLALILAGTVLAVLGSETGSRWLLEQGLGMQRGLEARYQRGTWLGGLELADVRWQSPKQDLRIRQLLARWSLWGLLRGELEVQRLQLDGVELRRLAPPSPDKTVLPTLRLPLRLVLIDAEARDLRYVGHGAATPLALRRLVLQDARWLGTRVRFRQLRLDHDALGQLALGGTIRLRGGYPLEAAGSFDFLPFREQGWGPVAVTLRRELADLELRLRLQGKVVALAQGRLQPLEKSLPYELSLQWQALALPWWSDQLLSSEGGELRLRGNRDGLDGSGSAQLAGRHLPAGRYRLEAATDWRSATLRSLVFNGLGGEARLQGTVGWKSGLRWDLTTGLTTIDLARKWPLPRLALPVLTGTLKSTGATSASGSRLSARLELAGGERWEVDQQAASWAWNLAARQQLSARWSGVERRLNNGQTIIMEAGELLASGHRDGYRAQLDTRLAGERLPQGQWIATVAGAGRALTVERLDYAGEQGSLAFQGRVDLAAPLRWSGELALDRFGSGWLLPDWPGQFSGRVAGGGQWGPARREFRLEELQLDGSLREQPLAVAGPLDVLLRPGAWPALRSPGLSLKWGPNQVVAIGGLGEAGWDLAAQLDLADLGLLNPSLRGGLAGQLALQGAPRRPDVQAALDGRDLARGGVAIGSARLEANLQALGDQPGTASLQLNGITTAGGRELGGASLDVSGTRDRHSLDWRLDGDLVMGQGSLVGGLDSRGWLGEMASGLVAVAGTEWQLAAPASLAWRQATGQLLLGAHCWRSAAARLCSEDELRLGRAGHLRLALDGLELERLHGLWPEGLVLTGVLGGTAAGDWAPGETPTVVARVAAGGGEVRLQRDEGQPPLVRHYERIELAADAGLDRLRLDVGLVSEDMGQGQARVQVDPRAPGKPLAGEISLQGLRLGVFQPFFPGLNLLAGQLSAEGRLGGVLARPSFTGQLRVSDGELALQRLPLSVRDLEAVVDVAGTSAQIRGSMKSGPGGATLTGAADWSDVPRLDLDLQGRRFALNQPPELQAEVDPDLHLRVLPRQVDLTGIVVVPSGRLNLQRLGARAVPLSPDVRIVHPSDREAVRAAGQVEDWSINADVRLRLGDDVYFQGYGVTGRLTGGLRLRQEGRRGLEASGEVELDRESRYDAYGQRLQIRRGRLIFAGNLSQPGLDVEAIRSVDDKVVGVRVEGRANQPEATLFSDTPMSQEEIVSYLVLGRPLDTQGRPDGSAGNLTAAAAAIKLGATGAGGLGLTNRVGETLGISDLSVDAEGNGDDTQFTVSGYLSPKLYLRYGVGIFTPVNTTTLRYKINSRLYLEAVSSLESAIDLFYNFRF